MNRKSRGELQSQLVKLLIHVSVVCYITHPDQRHRKDYSRFKPIKQNNLHTWIQLEGIHLGEIIQTKL